MICPLGLCSKQNDVHVHCSVFIKSGDGPACGARFVLSGIKCLLRERINQSAFKYLRGRFVTPGFGLSSNGRAAWVTFNVCSKQLQAAIVMPLCQLRGPFGRENRVTKCLLILSIPLALHLCCMLGAERRRDKLCRMTKSREEKSCGLFTNAQMAVPGRNPCHTPNKLSTREGGKVHDTPTIISSIEACIR